MISITNIITRAVEIFKILCRTEFVRQFILDNLYAKLCKKYSYIFFSVFGFFSSLIAMLHIQALKLFKIKMIRPNSFQLVPFWPNNSEVLLYYTEADIHEHGVFDQDAQLFAAVKSLPHDLNRHVTHSMFTNDVLEPY